MRVLSRAAAARRARRAARASSSSSVVSESTRDMAEPAEALGARRRPRHSLEGSERQHPLDQAAIELRRRGDELRVEQRKLFEHGGRERATGRRGLHSAKLEPGRAEVNSKQGIVPFHPRADPHLLQELQAGRDLLQARGQGEDERATRSRGEHRGVSPRIRTQRYIALGTRTQSRSRPCRRPIRTASTSTSRAARVASSAHRMRSA